MDDGREIAVKKLSQTSKQGKREFTNEAKLLACIQHRNVVSLLGYCAFPEKVLVYEYVDNESLDKLLFSMFSNPLFVLFRFIVYSFVIWFKISMNLVPF